MQLQGMVPANVYLFEVNNKTTRKKWLNMFKVNNKHIRITSLKYFTPFSVTIGSFEQANADWGEGSSRFYLA